MEETAGKEQKPKKKKSVARRVVKITLITLLSLVLLLLLAVGVALYVVFTPEKVTKVLNTYADRFLNADVQFEKVDITFLSTFPDFYLTLDKGSIVSHAIAADAPDYSKSRDSLLAFQSCRIQLDPVKYLKTKDVDIEEITFDGVTAYAYVTPKGTANWDIMLPSEPDTTESEFVIDDYVKSVTVKKISFNTKSVVYEDCKSNTLASLDNLRLALAGDFYQMKTAVDLEASVQGVNLKTDSVQLANNMDIGLETKLLADLDASRYDLDSATLLVNNNRFRLNGFVSMPDTDAIDMDLWLDGQIPALDLFKQLVPVVYLPILNHVEVKGKLDVDACVTGTYSKNSMPEIKASLFLDSAYINYDALGFAIRDINLVADAFIDLTSNCRSHANIDWLTLRTNFLSAKVKATLDNLLGDPLVSAKGKIKADVGQTLSYFPVLPKGMSAKGFANIDMNVNTLLSDATDVRLERIKADAKIGLDRFAFSSLYDTLYATFKHGDVLLKTNVPSQKVGGKALFDADADLDSVWLLYCDLAKGTVGSAKIAAQMAPEREGRVTSTVARFNLGNPNLVLDGDIDYVSDNTVVNLSMLPSKSNAASPLLNLGLNSGRTKIFYDSIDVDLKNADIQLAMRPINNTRRVRDSLAPRDTANRGKMRHQRFLELNTDQTIDYLLASLEPDTTAKGDTMDIVQNFLSRWSVNTDVKFNSAKVRTPDLNYPAHIMNANFSFDGKDLKVNALTVNVRRTDLQLTGTLKHLRRSVLGRSKWEGDFCLKSTLLKASDLMNILKSDAPPATTDSLAQSKMLLAEDTAISQIIVVPDNIDITLQTNLREVRYDKAVLNNVNGKIAVRNSYIILDGLNFKSTIGNVHTTLFYKAADKRGADVSADLVVDKLNITNLITQIPEIDTMLPMLRSFEGLISADIMALGKLTPNFDLDIPSINASCLVRGDSLVLLDNETFRKISKLLLFKNKDRNLIDSLSLEFVMKNKVINFFPFIFAIDRYKVGILGTQYADMTFDYKFVALKWPLLLKLLVKYKGDLNDLDHAKLRIGIDKRKTGYAKEFENLETFSTVRKQIQNVLRKGRQDAMQTTSQDEKNDEK
ncbi:MAG: AsmA family protein [Bacteroidales bacterium]|nr:AsmA family protein [Bacteroidales bacterium]